jgi:cytochrome c oxidase subunit III
VTSETDLLAAARADAHRAFAAHTPPARNAIWWAMVIALVAIGTIAAAFVYSYFYLRLGADSWPLPDSELRSLGLPAVALAAALTALVAAPTSGRPRPFLVLATAGGVIALTVQVVALVDSAYAIDANAYEALVITIEALGAVVLTSALAVRLAVVLLATSAQPDHRPQGLHDADAALWPGALGLWIALWLLVHVAPRMV